VKQPYSFFLLFFGIALHSIKQKNPKIKYIAAFYAAAILFSGTKEANAPAGIILAVYGIGFLLLRKDRAAKLTVLLGTVLLVTFSFYLYASIPESIKMTNKYQTVFYGVIRNSDTPQKDLKELGLDPGLAVLKNTTCFDSGLPVNPRSKEFKSAFYAKITFPSVAIFYLKHPARLVEKMKITARNSMMIRPPYLGNYPLTAIWMLWPENKPEAENIRFELQNAVIDTVKTGDYLLFGRFLGKPVLWRAIETGNEKGILVFSEKVLCFKSFDASEGLSGMKEDSNRKMYGSNCWEFSNLRDWLNSLDVKEIQEYVFERGFSCRKYPTAEAVSDCEYKSPLLNAERFCGYWLRTPYYGNSSYVRYVGEDGYVYHKDAFYGVIGIAPALYLKPDAVIIKGTGKKTALFSVIKKS